MMQIISQRSVKGMKDLTGRWRNIFPWELGKRGLKLNDQLVAAHILLWWKEVQCFNKFTISFSRNDMQLNVYYFITTVIYTNTVRWYNMIQGESWCSMSTCTTSIWSPPLRWIQCIAGMIPKPAIELYRTILVVSQELRRYSGWNWRPRESPPRQHTASM